jgi:hypothetical protein
MSMNTLANNQNDTSSSIAAHDESASAGGHVLPRAACPLLTWADLRRRIAG